MGTFDIILAAILVFTFIRGLMKGLFVEVASLVGLIGGIYGAIHFSYFVGDILKAKVDWDEKYITLTSFVITFGVIVVAISLLGKVLTKLADFAYLGWINKIVGGIFGSLKTALIMSVVLMVFDKFNNTIPFVDEEDIEQSILYEPIRKLGPILFPSLVKDGNDNEQEEEGII